MDSGNEVSEREKGDVIRNEAGRARGGGGSARGEAGSREEVVSVVVMLGEYRTL